MLPKYVEMLKEADVGYHKTKKLSLDEQEWEQINETLHIAIEYNLPVIFSLWVDGFFEEVKGAIEFIDQLNKVVNLVDIKEGIHKLGLRKLLM